MYYEGVLKVGAYESRKLRRRFVTVLMTMQDHDRLQVPVNEPAADRCGGSCDGVLRRSDSLEDKLIERIGLKLKHS